MVNVFVFFRLFFSLLLSASGILLILLSSIILCSVILSFVENKTILETLYLSFITALTIGYGDICPETIIGKIISILLGIIGMIFTGIFVAAAIKSLEKASTMKEVK